MVRGRILGFHVDFHRRHYNILIFVIFDSCDLPAVAFVRLRYALVPSCPPFGARVSAVRVSAPSVYRVLFQIV